MTRLPTDTHILALCKGPERYVLLYTAETQCEALRTLGQWASNKELSLSWMDAAILSQKIRQEVAS